MCIFSSSGDAHGDRTAASAKGEGNGSVVTVGFFSMAARALLTNKSAVFHTFK